MDKSRFEEIVEKHNYEIFRRPKEQGPNMVFIAERHTPDIRQRNIELLKEVLTTEDLLLLENVASEFSYQDLHEQFFENTGMTREPRESIVKCVRDIQDDINKSGESMNDACDTYLKQVFPCKTEGAEDIFFYLASNAFVQLDKWVCNDFFNAQKQRKQVNLVPRFFKKMCGIKIEEPLSDEEYFSLLGKLDASKRFLFFTNHYRNLAFARTIKQKQNECKGVLYFVVGAAHVLSSSQLTYKGRNYSPDHSFGELTAFLRLTEPPIQSYIIGQSLE